MRALHSVFALVGACVSLFAVPASYTYDSLNRLIRVSYADGTAIVYTYDSAGNRLSQVITNPSMALPRAAADKASLGFSTSVGQASATQVVVIQNAGGGSLQWNAVASVPWLNVTPNSGTNAGAINVTASAASLAAGSYSGSVILYASASNTPLSIPVTLIVMAGSSRPAINDGGVVSAAGYQAVVARGSVGSLFGSSLSDTTESATTVPLPRTLSGVRVTVNGVEAPLWYVSPGQINFQVPFEAPMTGVVPVIASKNGVSSPSVNVQVQEYAPAVFMYERKPGVLNPIVVRANNTIVTPDNPAVPDDILVVYGTGLGNLTTLPQTGAVSPASPLAKSPATPTITLGGVPVEVQFSGLTPGAIGLAQFNIKLPGTLPKASTLPLVIQFGSASSVPVDLAVKPEAPKANVQLVFTPNPVAQASDGKWYYSLQLRETSGVGVKFAKLIDGGVDDAYSIATWWSGSMRIAPYGQLGFSIITTCTSCSSTFDYVWQLTGEDDNGNVALTWSGSVRLLAPGLKAAP